MEPTEKPVRHIITLLAEVETVEEKFSYFNWEKDAFGNSTSTTKSLGWYVQFVGSTESIRLWESKPDWKPGDKVKIHFVNEGK